MKKLLLVFLSFTLLTNIIAQQNHYWRSHVSADRILTDKSVARLSFPKDYKLFDLDITPLRQDLFSIVGNNASRRSAVISLPNADGNIEQFEVFEASNFEPALQARFPEIRAYSGKGITDRYASLKISISPQGIQTMVFRSEKPCEFIEAYSQDHSVYAVFKSQRQPGQLPWTCNTQDQRITENLNTLVMNSGVTGRSTGDLKTLRLAQSCNAEYSNYFGATSATQVALVLAAFNATLTRCNGCYEKDLAIHLNLIANTTSVIYYNPSTDPYTNMNSWNSQLQSTLNSVIGAANYDIGHMFGKSGGGGNAGCIGCVCVDNTKGSGITSPADGIPQGDNFDIDYVVHEVGHQLGANHTFSNSNENTGVNMEIGSGITIMGYAGITSQDVAPHSIDIYHQASIAQIQTNIGNKTCPVTTSLTGNNATPVVAPVSNYTIPISTPFALTGSATDADNDPITYCWEENDNGTSAVTGANSKASPTKTVGPNWISFSPTTSPTRYCPQLATILTGGLTTGPLPGGDAGMNMEALSSVARTLKFRLTVRDNCPYSSTAPVKVGQTSYTDMTVTVSAASGPFAVTVPNTAVSWAGGSTQTVTWDVANTTASPVSCANVRILLSTDGGQTFPTVLAANTPNDGTESVVIPNTPTSTARIKVESIGNIFFDIDNANFTITVPPTGFSFGTPSATSIACAGPTTATTSLTTASTGGFTTPINLTSTGAPTGTSITFSPNPVTPGNTTTVTLNNANTLAPGNYNITINGLAGTSTQQRVITFVVNPGSDPVITTQPANQTVCPGSAVTFNSVTSTSGVSYQWQVSTNGGTSYSNLNGATSATYTINNANAGLDNNKYRVIISTLCASTTSNAATLLVGGTPSITSQPSNAVVCAGSNNVFSVSTSGSGVNYQWQVSTNGGNSYSNINGATSASYTINNVNLNQNGNLYHVIITSSCSGSVTSNSASLSVGTSPNITTQPSSVTSCAGTSTTFTSAASGSGLSYQWQISTNGGTSFTNIGGATSATYSVTASAALNGNRYRVIVTSSACATPTTSNNALLTVNDLPAIGSQPQSTTVCTGSPAFFLSSGSGTGISYQWQISTNGGATFTNVAGATSADYTIPNSNFSQNGDIYHLVVNGTCAPAATSNNVTLNVVNPASVSVQPSSTAVCDGSNASFSVTASGTTTYTWQVSTDGGSNYSDISGASNSTLTLNAASLGQNGSLYHVLVSNETCTTPVSSNAATLTVHALPVVIAGANGITNVCTGTPVILTGSGASTYSWSPAGGTGSSVTVTPTVNQNTPEQSNTIVYTATGTDGNGCVSTGTVSITANPLPVVTLTATPANTSLLPGRTVTLKARVSPSGFSFIWRKNGVVISNTSDSLKVGVEEIGSYTVEATDANGYCNRTSAAVVVKDSVTNNIYVYPNPNDGLFTVSSYTSINNTNQLKKQNVTVYDSRGALVYKKTYDINQGYNLLSVPMKNVASGTYFVVLNDAYNNRIGVTRVFVKP